MKFRRELLARFDVPGPTRFREISVRHQTSQEFAIEVNDRVTGFLKDRLESQRQGGLTRARLSGEPVNHVFYFRDRFRVPQEESQTRPGRASQSRARREEPGAKGTTLPRCRRKLGHYFRRRKNLLPVPTVTLTELLTTPPTVLHPELGRLPALSSVKLKPAASAGHDSVNWFPDRLADNDGRAEGAIEYS